MERRVCVTGAGGFVGSWLVKLLLSKGYTVHGTVRNPSDEKNAHLKKLDRATQNLHLFPADILDHDAVASAVEGCEGVFHVACPVPSGKVPDPEVEIVTPAVMGTLNVLKACSEAKVKRVVVVSSGAAVVMSSQWGKQKIMDEDSWSDPELCRASETFEGLSPESLNLRRARAWKWISEFHHRNMTLKNPNHVFESVIHSCSNWYYLAKTLAEREALDYGKKHGLEVVTICPTWVLGPLLQSSVNTSSLILISLLKGARGESTENKFLPIVDVRDVADALLLAYEKSEASGRYICSPHRVSLRDMVDLLKSKYPDYKYPKEFIEMEEGSQLSSGSLLSSEKLKSLGWKYRTLEESLIDSIEYYREAGLLV